jgi:hypothetical protein
MPPLQQTPRVVDVLAETAETAGETVATVVEVVAVEAVVIHATPNKVNPFQATRPGPQKAPVFFMSLIITLGSDRRNSYLRSNKPVIVS